MRKWKLILVTILLAGLMSGIYVSANCSASATSCNASCQVTAPPGGSTQCTGTRTSATCRAFDANGNQCKFIRCNCTGPCLAMVPTC